MFFTLTVKSEVSAAHYLSGEIFSENCKSRHGHNYQIEVLLSSPILDEVGMVIDAGFIKSLLKSEFDHKDLTEVMHFKGGLLRLNGPINATAENFAQIIAMLLQFKIDKAVNDTRKLEDQLIVESVMVEESRGIAATFVTQYREERDELRREERERELISVKGL